MRLGRFLEYKGYVGSIEYDLEDKIYFGSLLNIKDFIGYHALYGDELLKNYHDAVDKYIEIKRCL